MITKEQMDALKERFVNAKTEAERQAVNAEIHEICEEDAVAVAEIVKLQLMETHKKVDEILVRKQLEEMLPAISLSYIDIFQEVPRMALPENKRPFRKRQARKVLSE